MGGACGNGNLADCGGLSVTTTVIGFVVSPNSLADAVSFWRKFGVCSKG